MEVMDLMTSVQVIEKMGDVETRATELEKRRHACAARTAHDRPHKGGGEAIASRPRRAGRARERAAQGDRHPSGQARAGSSRREAFNISGCKIDRGMRTPRQVRCKSPVFNSLAAVPAGPRKLQETWAGRGDRADAALTAGCTSVIRGPPTDPPEPRPSAFLIGRRPSPDHAPGPIDHVSRGERGGVASRFGSSPRIAAKSARWPRRPVTPICWR
jgi:hypothetical protein